MSKTDVQLQKLFLRQLFAQFIKSAEQKLTEIEFEGLDKEKDLSLSVMPGADLEFDAKITNLANITSHCPKLIIDSIMIWRNTRKSQTQEKLPEIQATKYPTVSISDLESRIKKRTSLLSNFILCRVLIAIIQNLGSKPLNTELGKKLEDMVFGQLRSADPEQTARFVNLDANVKFFAQLMGVLSQVRFPTISDRYIQEIRSIKGVDRNAELKLEMMISCMHYVKLKIYPMSALEDSADFLQALAELFQSATSARIKVAFCELFNDLLEPVAKVADAEVNVPIWQKTIELISPKVMRMVVKGKSLSIALPLTATLLTVSRKDYFLKNWPTLVDMLVQKFKERGMKSIALNSVCRLLWTYLFRCFDSPSSVVQKRTEFFKKALFPAKRPLIPSDCDLDVFVRIVYYVTVKYPEYGNEEFITHLLSPEPIRPESESTSKSGENDELSNADRLYIGYRAFILLVRDVEQSIGDKNESAGAVSAVQSNAGLVLVEGKLNLKAPKFPSFEGNSDGSFEYLQDIGNRDVKRGFEKVLPLNLPLNKDVILRMGSSMTETLTLVNESIGRTLALLHTAVGKKTIVDQPSALEIPARTFGGAQIGTTGSAQSMPIAPPVGRRPSAVVDTLNSFTGIPTRQEIFNDVDQTRVSTVSDALPETVYPKLLRTILDSIPRFYPKGLTPTKVVEMLSSYGLHADPAVQEAAFQALCRIAKVKRFDPQNEEWKLGADGEMLSAGVYRIFSTYNRSAIILRYKELWVSGEKLERGMVNIAKRSLELLDIWLDDISTNSMYLPSQSEADKITEDIEANGLMYLCGMDPDLRASGIEFLQKTEKFRTALALKLPKDNLSRMKQSSFGRDSFERLSLFQGGKRASLYQKISRNSRLATEKETAKKEFVSVFNIMVDQGQNLVRESYSDTSDSTLSRRELYGEKRDHQIKLLEMENPLIYVAQSKDEADIAIWYRCYPAFLKSLVEFSDQESLKTTFRLIWDFLRVMQPVINGICGDLTIYRPNYLPTSKMYEKPTGNYSQAAVDNLINYWKQFASFCYACLGVLNLNDGPQLGIDAKPFGIVSASELNRNSLALLSSERQEVRKAAVFAIGCIQTESFAPLLTDIQPFLTAIVTEAQTRIKKPKSLASQQETAFERMRTQLSHLLTFIASFAKFENYRKQQNVMNSITDYISAMTAFLSDSEVQLEWKHQTTRFYFCTFIEKFYKFLIQSLGSNSDESIDKYFPFSLRKQLFLLFEGWCAHGVDGDRSRQREATMMATVLDTIKDMSERGAMTTKMEVHRKAVQLASLKTMASLCRGSLSAVNDPNLVFDISRITAWINSLLDSATKSFHMIARSAIENIISFNSNSNELFEQILSSCYNYSSESNVPNGYFLGFVDIACKKINSWKISKAKSMCLALFQLGSSNATLRKAAGRLLAALEQSAIEEDSDAILDWYAADDEPTFLDIEAEEEVEENYPNNGTISFGGSAVSSNLPVVYRNAQLLVANKLGTMHQDLAPQILSEITFRIHHISAKGGDHSEKIRSLLSILSAFVSPIEIHGDFSVKTSVKDLTAEEEVSWICLNNIFYLSAAFNDPFPNEIAAIWKSVIEVPPSEESLPFTKKQKLLTKKIGKVLDFLSRMVVKLQNPKTILIAKSVMIYLSRSNFGGKLVELLIGKLEPSSMATISTSTIEVLRVPRKMAHFSNRNLYMANSDVLFHPPMPSLTYSLCYLYLALLIDVTFELDQYALVLHLPTLLTIIFGQLDSGPQKCEEMRVLLVNLIQSLLARDQTHQRKINPILSALSKKEGRRVWKYEDPTPDHLDLESTGQMAALALELADLFTMINPEMRIAWGKETLNWGTNSPDRHVACRSLQVFRALMPKFEQSFLYNLINSLSTAISDSHSDFQHHSLDLLLTLNQIVTGLNGSEILELYPQLFWVSLGLLTSVHEWEYLEGLKLLGLIIEKIDIKKQSIINMLMSTLPSKWPGGFSGLFIPVSRGLCSSKTEALALQIINSMLFVSVPIFLDTRPAKCLLVTLANLPKLLQVYDYESGLDGLFEAGHSVIESCLSSAEMLASACALGNCESLSRLLVSFSNQRIKKRNDFLKQLILIIQEDFLSAEADVVKLCMSMLTNSMAVYPTGMLVFLEMLFTDVSQRSTPLALPFESNSGWIRPLIALLSTDHGPQASHLLDVILGGRLKSTEAEIIVNVGGAQNVYGYVRKARGDTPTYLPSGWLVEEFMGEGSLLAKRRLSTVAKACQPAVKDVVERDIDPKMAKEMMAKFRDFERHFRSKLLTMGR